MLLYLTYFPTIWK